MSIYVTLQCDRCYGKLGSGSSVKEARREAKVYGLRHVAGLDLCSVCADDGGSS